MVNHIRNLLLNVRQAGFPADYPGEEYIPRTFIPRKLTPPLQYAYRVLFGTMPDRLFLNYRARQLMGLLYSTELSQYVTELDSRVTFVPVFTTDRFFDDVFKISIEQIVGEGDRLYVRGEHVANEAIGRCEQLWDITVTSDTTVTVQTRREPKWSQEYTIDYSQGLSTEIVLHGSSLTVQWHQVPVGTRWQILSRGRPSRDLSTVLSQLDTFGGHGDQEVFPPMAADPVATFEKVWRQNELMPYRYSALLLAMAWRINQLPQETT